MNNKSLVSVIIPCYNHEKYVANTIESVILQTYQNLEILIIDDHSTDISYDTILSLEENIKQRCISYKIIRNDSNLGTAQTLNKIAKFANGEYVYLIASDDIALPNAIETLHNCITQNPQYSLIACNNVFIDQNGKEILRDKFSTFGEQLRNARKDVDWLSEDFGSYKTLLSGNYITNGYLIKLEALKSVNYWGYPLEDYALMLALAKEHKFKYLDQVLFQYRIHPHNSINNQLKMTQDTLIVLQKEQEYATKNGYFEEFHKQITSLMQGIISIIYTQSHNIKPIKFADVKRYFKQKMKKILGIKS